MTVDNVAPSQNALSPAARSLWAYALTECCQAHVLLQEDEENQQFSQWHKLRRKLAAFLTGELKSASNLERFYMEFCEWEDTYSPPDTLNGRITDLMFSATHAAVNALYDEECDDRELIENTIQDLYKELAELGGDVAGLSDYWNALNSEWTEKLHDIRQRPVASAIMKEVCSTEISIFGLSS